MPTQQNIAPDDVITAIRFPIRLLTLVCLLTIISFAWFVWIIFDSRRDTKMFTDRLSRIEELRGVIVHLDEVLTMSARMSAATGDPQWEKRYRHFEPQLDAAIKELTKTGTGPSDIKAATETDAANIKLEEMGTRAFALARAGRKEEAQAVLFNPEYETQKRIYAEGIMSFANQVRHEFDESLRDDQRIDLLSLIAAVVVGGTAFVAWLSAARGVRRWRAQLLDSFHRRAEAEDNLHKAHAELALREGEARYRLMVDHSPDAILVICDEKIVFVNPAAVELLGASRPEQLTGRTASEIVYPGDRAAISVRLSEVVEGKRLPTAERRLLRFDGSTVEVESRVISFLYEGKPALQVTVRDITDRRTAEKQLRAADEKYRSIFDNALEGIFQSTPDGVFLSANPAFARMLGFASAEELLLERNDIKRQSYADPVKHQEFKRLLEQDGFVNGFEFELKRKDGSRIWVSENARIVRDAAGSALYYEGSALDITERKQAGERMRAILESALDCVITMDHQGRIVEFNPAAEKTFGYKRDGAIGQLLADLIIPPALRESHQRGLAHYLSTGDAPALGKRIELTGMRSDTRTSRKPALAKPRMGPPT